MIRLILTGTYVVLFLILTSPLMGITYLIGKKYPEKADRMSMAIVFWGFRCVRFLSGVKVTTIGKENIPLDTAVLYVGNHSSFFDIVASYPECPNPTGFVAKKSMLKAPLLRVWMKRLHCLFLDRDNMREGLKIILEGVANAKSGISTFIFPEGTRNDTDRLLPFKEGSFKIAEKSGCPIIPVAITGSRDIFEQHFPKITKGKITIQYGQPIDPDQLSKEEKKFLGAYTQERIQTMIDQQSAHSAS